MIGRHGVLADSEMQIASGGIRGALLAGAFKRQQRFRRGRQVRRAADQPGHVLRDGVQHFARRIPRGQALGVGWERRQVFVPAFGKLPVLHAVELIGQLRILGLVIGEEFHPVASRSSPPRSTDPLLKVLIDALRDKKLRVFGPAVVALGGANFLFAERLAVRFPGVLLFRSAKSDVTVDDDQAWGDRSCSATS